MTNWPLDTLPANQVNGGIVQALTDVSQDADINVLRDHVVALEASVAANQATIASLSAQQTSEVLYARKTADESVASNATISNGDDHLVLPCAANTDYELFMVLFPLGLAAADIKTALSVPPAASLFATIADWTAANAASATTYYDELTIHPSGIDPVTILPIVVTGLLRVGTAGNVQLFWGQNSSNVTATVLKAGSFLRLRRLT